MSWGEGWCRKYMVGKEGHGPDGNEMCPIWTQQWQTRRKSTKRRQDNYRISNLGAQSNNFIRNLGKLLGKQCWGWFSSNTHTHAQTHTYTHTDTHRHTDTHTHTQTHTHRHIHTHTDTHRHTDTHTHTHTHTHTRAHLRIEEVCFAKTPMKFKQAVTVERHTGDRLVFCLYPKLSC